MSWFHRYIHVSEVKAVLPRGYIIREEGGRPAIYRRRRRRVPWWRFWEPYYATELVARGQYIQLPGGRRSQRPEWFLAKTAEALTGCRRSAFVEDDRLVVNWFGCPKLLQRRQQINP